MGSRGCVPRMSIPRDREQKLLDQMRVVPRIGTASHVPYSFVHSIHRACSDSIGSVDFFFFFFLGSACSMWKFPGLGLNPHHSSDLSCCGDDAGSFTDSATGELYLIDY